MGRSALTLDDRVDIMRRFYRNGVSMENLKLLNSMGLEFGVISEEEFVAVEKMLDEMKEGA